MKEELISFETAKLAKEKGFGVKTKKSFMGRKEYSAYNLRKGEDRVFEKLEPRLISSDCEDNNNYIVCYAPTQSLLQRWLREKHNIFLNLYFESILHYHYVNIVRWNEIGIRVKNKINHFEFNSYEEALEIGLQKALKLIEKK